MASYFSSLSLRERLLIGIAGFLSIVMVAYFYLWEPKMVQLAQLRDQKVPQSQQTLAAVTGR